MTADLNEEGLRQLSMRLPTLKPCPFCGGEAHMELTRDTDDGFTGLVILTDHRDECIIRDKRRINYGYFTFNLEDYPSTTEFLSSEFAMQWNRREGT